MKLQNNKTIFLVAVVVSFMLITGCRSNRLQPQHKTETKIEYKTIVKDSIVKLPADSSAIKALYECDSLNNVILTEIKHYQGSNIETESNHTRTQTGGLYVENRCKVDSSKVYLRWKENHVKETISDSVVHVKYETIEVEKEVKRSPVPWMIGGGLIILVIVILYNSIKNNIKRII